MTQKDSPLEVLETPEYPIPDFSDMVAKSETRKVNRKAQAADAETSLQLLKRLFGDDVYDVFPPDLMSAVDDAYKFWRDNPNSYLATRFEDMTSLRDAEKLMRAYSEVAGEEGYTIRTVGSDDPLVLVWRAQTRRTVKKGEEDEEEA